jgi:hypothetical protein
MVEYHVPKGLHTTKTSTQQNIKNTYTHNIFHNTFFHSIVFNINTKHRKPKREREIPFKQNKIFSSL